MPINSALNIKADLSIVIPTFNENKNIEIIYYAIKNSISHKVKNFQVIFVDDDSTDGTQLEIEKLQQIENNVFVIERIGRSGLASAVQEGIIFAQSPYIIVMDADMQHDESKLFEIYDSLVKGNDIVVCGRDFNSRIGLSHNRIKLSRIGNRILNVVLPKRIEDPLTGYFGINRQYFMTIVRDLNPIGFKILFDILSSSRNASISEITAEFKDRAYGESKLNSKIFVDAFELLLTKIIGKYIPAQFILFCSVGFVGAFFHVSLLWFLLRIVQLPFVYCQAIATVFTMIINYYNNSLVTFRNSKPLGGKLNGLLLFSLICSVGGALNLLTANFLYIHDVKWWFSGLAGAGLGAVWNFVFSKSFIWRK